MTQYGVVEDPTTVDYETHCCCKTTDDKYYNVPKEFFKLNAALTKHKLFVPEPFDVPIDSEHFQKLLILMEQATVVDMQISRPSWTDSLDKAGVRFVSSCLNLGSWDGSRVFMYESKLPKKDEVVYVKVVRVNDTSATVQLLEYGNIEGIIPYTEVTKRRVRSMGKLIRVGKHDVAQILRIDTEKGYIDLSKKVVVASDYTACKERFAQGGAVRSIVCHVAEECDIPPQKAMEMLAYPLYRKKEGKHALTWLQELHDTKDVDGILGDLNLPQPFIDALMANLANTFKRQVLNLAANVEIKCSAFDGVDIIRDTLLIAQNYGKDMEPSIPIAVMIIGAPLYSLRIRTDRREAGLARLQEALAAMQKEITSRGGSMKITEGPTVLNMSDKDANAGDDGADSGDSSEGED